MKTQNKLSAARYLILKYFIVVFLLLIPLPTNAGSVYVEFSNEDKGHFENLSKTLYDTDNSDGHFSQGLYFSYTTDGKTKNQKITYSLEQDIYTPSFDNKKTDTAVIGDRPFAGYLGRRRLHDKNEFTTLQPYPLSEYPAVSFNTSISNWAWRVLTPEARQHKINCMI